jgi:putative membrane protein
MIFSSTVRTTFTLAAVAAVAVACASPAPRRTVTVPAAGPNPTIVTPAPVGTTVVTPAPSGTVVTPAPSTTVVTPVPGTTVVTPLTPADSAALISLAQDSIAEVRLAQLAQQRSASDQIRMLAQRLIADHNRANAQLYPLAQQRGVVIPQTLDPMYVPVEQRLSALSGPQFDVAFLEQMIADHAKASAMLDRIAATAVDPALRSWATSQLPVIREHQAQTLGLHAQLARTPVGSVGTVQPSASPVIIVPSR